jgi:shikimate dehydrogenase
VPADRFEDVMRRLMTIRNFHGSMITYPFKASAAPLVDRLLESGRQVGAINAMRREADGSWTGEIFDGLGLTRGLDYEGVEIAGRRILLLGAGGAGSAIAFALADSGAAAVTLFDIDEARAAALAKRVKAAFPGCDVQTGESLASGYDVVINATPLGMAPGDGLPTDPRELAPDTVVVDIVPKPNLPFLKEARERGCRTIDFHAMRCGQMDEICKFFGVG